jgi:hypothetical protein
MARRPTQRQIFEALEERFGRAVAVAFTESVNDLRAGVSLSEVIAALEAGDIERAVRAFNLDPSAMRPLERSIALAYETAGGQVAASITAAANRSGLRTVMRFNLRNPRAEQWLVEMALRNTTAFTADQVDTLREALRSGMEAGRGPRNTALDVAGRINRQTGRRVGGVIGLTGQQSGYVASARAELASGDPAQMRNYLTRSLRDKRFDATVREAIENGVPVDADTITRATGQYSDTLLRQRGETIARTESLQALNAGQNQAFRQSIDDGLVEADAITKEWDSAGDGRVRDAHADMDGDTVTMDEAFTSPSGARLMHPLDGSLGAPASEIISCRCRVSYKVDHFRGLE